MSSLSLFLKDNKKKKQNATFPATRSLCDSNGNVLDWIIRPLSTKENEMLRDECTKNIPIRGKKNQYKQDLDTWKYIAKMICACVVEPDLNNKELQDSYGVRTPEDLVKEMIDDPGEYDEFAQFIQNYNGFDETIQDRKDKAKN